MSLPHSISPTHSPDSRIQDALLVPRTYCETPLNEIQFAQARPMADSLLPAPSQDHRSSRQLEARLYAPPTLNELGTVGAVTAGPNDGALDQLGGASGGFLVANGTS